MLLKHHNSNNMTIQKLAVHALYYYVYMTVYILEWIGVPQWLGLKRPEDAIVYIQGTTSTELFAQTSEEVVEATSSSSIAHVEDDLTMMADHSLNGLSQDVRQEEACPASPSDIQNVEEHTVRTALSSLVRLTMTQVPSIEGPLRLQEELAMALARSRELEHKLHQAFGLYLEEKRAHAHTSLLLSDTQGKLDDLCGYIESLSSQTTQAPLPVEITSADPTEECLEPQEKIDRCEADAACSSPQEEPKSQSQTSDERDVTAEEPSQQEEAETATSDYSTDDQEVLASTADADTDTDTCNAKAATVLKNEPEEDIQGKEEETVREPHEADAEVIEGPAEGPQEVVLPSSSNSDSCEAATSTPNLVESKEEPSQEGEAVSCCEYDRIYSLSSIEPVLSYLLESRTAFELDANMEPTSFTENTFLSAYDTSAPNTSNTSMLTTHVHEDHHQTLDTSLNEFFGALDEQPDAHHTDMVDSSREPPSPILARNPATSNRVPPADPQVPLSNLGRPSNLTAAPTAADWNRVEFRQHSLELDLHDLRSTVAELNGNLTELRDVLIARLPVPVTGDSQIDLRLPNPEVPEASNQPSPSFPPAHYVRFQPTPFSTPVRNSEVRRQVAFTPLEERRNTSALERSIVHGNSDSQPVARLPLPILRARASQQASLLTAGDDKKHSIDRIRLKELMSKCPKYTKSMAGDILNFARKIDHYISISLRVGLSLHETLDTIYDQYLDEESRSFINYLNEGVTKYTNQDDFLILPPTQHESSPDSRGAQEGRPDATGNPQRQEFPHQAGIEPGIERNRIALSKLHPEIVSQMITTNIHAPDNWDTLVQEAQDIEIRLKAMKNLFPANEIRYHGQVGLVTTAAPHPVVRRRFPDSNRFNHSGDSRVRPATTPARPSPSPSGPSATPARSPATSNSKENVRCYNCNKFGHFSKECPTKTTTPTRPSDKRGVNILRSHSHACSAPANSHWKIVEVCNPLTPRPTWTTMDVYLDTGSELNMISESEARRLQLEVKPLPHGTIELVAFNETTIGRASHFTVVNMKLWTAEIDHLSPTVHGNVTLETNAFITPVMFHVVDSPHIGLLLGGSFISQTKTIMDAHTDPSVFVMRDRTTLLKLENEPSSRCTFTSNESTMDHQLWKTADSVQPFSSLVKTVQYKTTKHLLWYASTAEFPQWYIVERRNGDTWTPLLDPREDTMDIFHCTAEHVHVWNETTCDPIAEDTIPAPLYKPDTIPFDGDTKHPDEDEAESRRHVNIIYYFNGASTSHVDPIFDFIVLNKVMAEYTENQKKYDNEAYRYYNTKKERDPRNSAELHLYQELEMAALRRLHAIQVDILRQRHYDERQRHNAPIRYHFERTVTIIDDSDEEHPAQRRRVNAVRSRPAPLCYASSNTAAPSTALEGPMNL
ncbi:hypothetical protein PROFUN_15692 [Planoprotostelium fungivorum]|uniref:CCHC-type domain-containing protein n=1 Tax=Planoprotostelium fungivorum TaxID=1890364 RepID=A0A2P6MYY8_9EUKA|nr:hypothetical protein PROFUN_15692 [Planoprotostelium fungivorum]